MTAFFSRIGSAFLIAAIWLTGCAVPVDEDSGVAENAISKSVLRVGVTANYPPLVDKVGGKLVGIEIDFANEVGKYNPDSIFYVRTVRNTDDQGIWGIIHDGIMTNFAQGMAIRRGKEVNTYKVDIPRDADELLQDRTSSYLGKLIHRKAAESYVYNFKKNRMGKNPDQVLPGQEIVIINFEPEELIGIYKHFVAKQG